MRLLVVTALAVALSPGVAQAALFDPPVTLGTAPTLATAAVAGGGGSFAFVARRQNAIVGAVRPGDGAPWVVRTLARSSPYAEADQQIVRGSDGAITALWTDSGPRSGLVAARAPAGKSFSAARVVARLDSAHGARPRLVALPGGRVLVTFVDRALLRPRRLSSHTRLKTLVLDRGRPGAVRDLGVEGAFPATARVSNGGALVYVAGAPRCRRSVCAPRALRATLLDAAGRRTGATVTVAGDVGTYFNPPRVTTLGSRAVVSWVQPSREAGSATSALTREYSTRPLRSRTSARTFPVYGGPGTGSATVAILPGGVLLGAGVGAADPGEPFGGKAQFSLAARGASWQAPTTLSAPAGWTTVPQIRPLSDGGALLIYARSRSTPGPVTYDVIATHRTASGTTTRTTLGSSLNTNDAAGLSSSVAVDGQAIVSWPDVRGGVAIVLRH